VYLWREGTLLQNFLSNSGLRKQLAAEVLSTVDQTAVGREFVTLTSSFVYSTMVGVAQRVERVSLRRLRLKFT